MTSILPTAAERAVAQLDSANQNLFRALQSHQTQANRILTQSKGDDGKTLLAHADIQAAAGDRYSSLSAFLEARDAILAFAPTATTVVAPASEPAAAPAGSTNAPAAAAPAPANLVAASPSTISSADSTAAATATKSS